MHMWTLLALALVIAAPARAAAGELQSPPAADVRIAEAGVVQQLTLIDGSRLYGRVESIEGAGLVFRTIAGVTMAVQLSDVRDLRVARGRVVNSEFHPQDSHDTRLFFAPTARSLPRGEGYVGVYEIVLPFVQVGVTDRFSIGGGTPLVFSGDVRAFWFTPKLQLVARERVQVAAGILHVSIPFEDVPDGGIAYGVATVGAPDRSASFGLGYAYSAGNRTPIAMIGGETRTGRRLKLMTESWFWTGGGNGVVSGGIRFLGERLSADLALMVPLFEEATPFPLVSFAWRF